MFRVRVMTPPVVDDEGRSLAGAELCLGGQRFQFPVDLSHWRITDYERQWRDGIVRLVRGAASTALMTAYRGVGAAMHHMWGFWRKQEHVYVQQHPVVVSEADVPFDPAAPYPHLGERIPSSEHGLPLPEWRLDMVYFYAAALGIRWPLV
jgi:hypothetical protein